MVLINTHMQVIITVPAIEIDMCEAMMPLFLGIGKENMGEQGEPDTKEFDVVLSKLRAVDSGLW